MNRALKLAGGAVAALALAGAGTVAYLAANLDAYLKQEFAAAVARQTGRTLTFEDDLSIDLWPRLAVRLGRVSLSERGSAQAFARLAAARIAIEPLPLLSRRVAVEAIEIDGLEATLIRRQDGTLNFADLLPGKAEKVGAGETAQPAVAPLPAIGIAAFRIGDARLAWRDERSGKEFALADIELSGGPLQFAAGGVEIAALRLAAGAQLKDARIRAELASPLAFDAEKRSVALPQLAGRLELSHPRLVQQTLALPLAGTAHADFARQEGRLRLESRLDASHLEVTADIGSFAPFALVFAVAIDRLDLDKYLLPAGDGGKLDLAFLDGLDLRGTLQIGRLTAARLAADNVRLNLDTRDRGQPDGRNAG